jgi:hypothetical protein
MRVDTSLLLRLVMIAVYQKYKSMLDKFTKWFYEFEKGHPFLLREEVDIICNTRSEEKYLWMNDNQIKRLIKIRVREMYKKKYPDAKRWGIIKR